MSKNSFLAILKTIGTSVLGMIITALIQHYAPALTLPAVGAVAAATTAAKSPFSS